jgi:hypothetical protein
LMHGSVKSNAGLIRWLVENVTKEMFIVSIGQVGRTSHLTDVLGAYTTYAAKAGNIVVA